MFLEMQSYLLSTAFKGKIFKHWKCHKYWKIKNLSEINFEQTSGNLRSSIPAMCTWLDVYLAKYLEVLQKKK